MTAVSKAPAASQSATAFPRLNSLRRARGHVRLGTLNNLRWLAVVGQAIALLAVRVVLNFDFPLLLAAISFLWQAHLPLPWSPVNGLRLPALYQFGIWVSLILGIGFTSIYAWRIASEATRMSAALSATQLALAREHRLGALGALAAAAAHELGTPLGTIAVVAHELERELKHDAHADDFRLLRAEAERCRAILARLAQPEESVLGQTERLPLGALLDDIAAPHRGLDVTISLDLQPGPPPKVWRVPEILHGLGNLIENAADFASKEVRLRARWDNTLLVIEVMDDGPGFAAEIFEQIGEPYITSRPARRSPMDGEVNPADGKQEGMGLGFFIAKTLIEQTGGVVSAHNRMGGGATVTATWPRGAIDGDAPPRQELGP